MESKTVWDFGFQKLDSRFFVSGSCRMDSRDCNHYWIPDSLSCIPFSKTQHFQFHKQHFPGFWIPQAKLSWIPESRFPQMGDINLLSVFFFVHLIFSSYFVEFIGFIFNREEKCGVTLPWQHYYWMTTKPTTTATVRRTAKIICLQ